MIKSRCGRPRAPALVARLPRLASRQVCRFSCSLDCSLARSLPSFLRLPLVAHEQKGNRLREQKKRKLKPNPSARGVEVKGATSGAIDQPSSGRKWSPCKLKQLCRLGGANLIAPLDYGGIICQQNRRTPLAPRSHRRPAGPTGCCLVQLLLAWLRVRARLAIGWPQSAQLIRVILFDV